MKKGMHVMAVLLAGMIFLQIGFMICCYQNYLDKMDILNRVAVSDAQSGLDTAIEILKAEDVKNTENTKKTDKTLVLEQYGYRQSLRNRYFARFLKQCLFLTAGTALFLAVFLTVLYVREKQENKRNQVYLKSLGQYLDGFREAGMRQQASEAYPELPVPKGCEAEAESIRGQLEMLQAQLWEVQKQAFTEKERTKSLVTDLSHQLKTPLSSVMLYRDMLEAPLEPEQQKAFLSKMKIQMEKMDWMVSSLFKMVWLEQGAMQFEAADTPLKNTLLLAVNTVYEKAEKKNIRIVMEPFEDRILLHNRKWTAEVFSNLLENAVKYSAADSRIEISVCPLELVTEIRISDHGIGIHPEELVAVFGRFYRSKEAENQEGAGIGLYLARLILEQEKGYLTVVSEHGKGSAFSVYLQNGQDTAGKKEQGGAHE